MIKELVELVPRAYRVPRYRIALVREGSEISPTNRYTNSRAVFDWARVTLFEDADRELFFVLALDSKNQLIGLNCVSVGSLSASVVHPREALKTLILRNAAAALFLHNHPSGDPSPSREDRECTARLVAACKVCGIRALDHVVCGDADYFSFADAGLMQDRVEVLP